MVNRANVEALAKLYAEMLDAWSARASAVDAAPGDGPDEDFAAEYLASRGVLVPSALTDADAEQIRSWVSREGYIVALQRIAKGE